MISRKTWTIELDVAVHQSVDRLLRQTIGATESIQALGHWALIDLSLLSQNSQDGTEVPLQTDNCQVLRQPERAFHLLINILVMR